MRTAEEILDQHLFNKFDEVDRKTFIEAMKSYAKEACKEQREICANYVDLTSPDTPEHGKQLTSSLQFIIKAAPEPPLV